MTWEIVASTLTVLYGYKLLCTRNKINYKKKLESSYNIKKTAIGTINKQFLNSETVSDDADCTVNIPSPVYIVSVAKTRFLTRSPVSLRVVRRGREKTKAGSPA